ncbi:MAG: pPIWI_RE module domain-containing protein, partial [Bacillota bacterium]
MTKNLTRLQTLTALIKEDADKTLNYYSLSFPEKWDNRLKAIYFRDDKNSYRKNIPIKVLNEILAAKYPEIISYNSGKNKIYTWLISKKKIDIDELFYNYISTWILKVFSEKAIQKELINLINSFKKDDLKWKKKEINLLNNKINSNGTYNPGFEYYKLIPDYFTNQLKDKTLIINGRNLKFKKAGTELISWPPEKVEVKQREEFYSLVLRIEPKTLPNFDKPIIQINPSFRRWVSLPLQYEKNKSNLKWYSNAGVYFEAGRFDNRSDLIKTELSNRKTHHEWANYHMDILTELDFDNKIPNLEDLIKNPAAFLKADKNKAAISLSTNFNNISYYFSKSGLTTLDNQEFFEETLKFLPELKNSNEELYLKQFSRQKKSAGDLYESRKDRKKEKRRKLIKEQLGTPVRFEIIYENKDMKERLLAEIIKVLGLDQSKKKKIYKTPELEVEIITRKEGKIISALEYEVDDKDKSYTEAFNQRINEIKSVFDKKNITTLSLVELRNVGGDKGFKNSKDPKKAIRKGLAKRNRLSQFITPIKDNEKKSTKESRVKSAVWDLFRQSGYLHYSPQVGLGKSVNSVPEELNIFGFYLINKRRKYDADIKYPIIISTQTNSYDIKLKYPDSNNEWKSYSKALLDIANNINKNSYKLNQDKINNFLFKVFNKEIINTKNPLLIADSANMGSEWKWINNYKISKEFISFGKA